MKLSVSNIAWDGTHDDLMYDLLQSYGFAGLEIAPTRIFSENPYDKLEEAKIFKKHLRDKYELDISSIQSVLYGVTANIFNDDSERMLLIEYIKKAIRFAEVLSCKNIVFGCPKNRIMSDEGQYHIAIEFFKKLADFASLHNTVIAIEPNPTIYGTNFINTTKQAFELAKEVSSPGFMVNIDLGTMIYNGESIESLIAHMDFIHHIHISEPYLAKIEHRDLHNQLKDLHYDNYISIEMKNLGDLESIKAVISYVSEVLK